MAQDVSVSVSGTCDRTATDGTTLAGQFAAATGGQTICLADGDYGTFTGGSKAGRVTVRPIAGATVAMAIDLTSARNITVDGMTVTSLEMSRSRDITLSNNRFTGQAIVHVGIVADANILFDHNTHIDIPDCTGCFQGRLHVDPEGAADSGVTIRNSVFAGGHLDGVRADATSIVIEDNEFRDLEDMDPFHTDPIQIYGGRRITIRRNFFHRCDVPSAIGGHDGNDHNVVEDNVIVGSSGMGVAISMASDSSSIIRHNTLVQGQCAWGWECGILTLESKTGAPPSTGTVVEDNILSEIAGGNGSGMTLRNNVFTGTQSPLYVGPATTYAGYRLAAGSPGKGAASDGSDVGIR